MVERPAFCFKLIFFILTLSTVHTNPCPSRPLWDARAGIFCQDPSWYHCLENQAGNIKEFCISPRYINQGRYPVVLIGGEELAEVPCPSSRYQPSGQLSNQYKSVTCMYIKDECKDDGEEPCDDGSDVSDRMCRCDFTHGYRSSEYLLSNPKLKSCYHPKTEFKGCIQSPCGKGQELNKAYQCVPSCPPGYFRRNSKDTCVQDPSIITSTEPTTTPTKTENSVEKKVTVMKDKFFEDHSAELVIGVILSLVGVFSVSILIWKIYQRYRLLQNKGGAELRKTEDNAYPYTDMHAIHKQDIGERIGRIKSISSSGEEVYGTGFRVGDRYVMTAYHVVHGLYDRFWKELNKGRIGNLKFHPEEGPCCVTDMTNCLETNKQETVKTLGLHMVTESSSILFGHVNDKTGTSFKFKFDVPFLSKKHDIAILELELFEDSSKYLPKSIDLASVYAPTRMLNILGYPGGRELKADPGCKIISDERELKKTIEDSIKFFSSLSHKISIDRSDFSKCEISRDQVLFHCSKSTGHGASGSPLIRNVNDHPEVIGMLLEGFPKVYYNEFREDKKANEHLNLLIESGISMEKVKILLQKHKLVELSKNIFE